MPAAVPPLVLREARAADDTAAACRLLGLVNPPRAGSLYVFVDLAAAPGAPPAAAALVVPARGAGGRLVELRQFAVEPSISQPALGARLLTCLADRLRAAGCERLVASVKADDPQRLDALRSAGFRPRVDAGDGEVSLELPL